MATDGKKQDGDLARIVAKARKLVELIPKSRDGWEPKRATRADEGKRCSTDGRGCPRQIYKPTTPETKETVATLDRLQDLMGLHLEELRYLVIEAPGCELIRRTRCHQMQEPEGYSALWWLSICPTGCAHCRRDALQELDAIEAVLAKPDDSNQDSEQDTKKSRSSSGYKDDVRLYEVLENEIKSARKLRNPDDAARRIRDCLWHWSIKTWAREVDPKRVKSIRSRWGKIEFPQFWERREEYREEYPKVGSLRGHQNIEGQGRACEESVSEELGPRDAAIQKEQTSDPLDPSPFGEER